MTVKDRTTSRSMRGVSRDSSRFVLAVLLLFAVQGWAATVTLLWDPGPDARTAGYAVHYGTASGSYPTRIDVGNATSFTIADLADGPTYFLVVSAYDGSGGVSPNTNEVSVQTRPTAPIVSFSATPTSGTAPMTVTFNGDSTGVVSTFVWNFGDGSAEVSGLGSVATSTTHNYPLPGSYTVNLSATGPGGGDSLTKSNLIVVLAAGPGPAYTCPCSLWDSSATPRNPSVASTAEINVGVRFTPIIDGEVTAIRFYKGQGNTGPHVASLWTGAGHRLATATHPDGLAAGWQQVDFAAPVPVTARTAYVASYHAPNGGQASDNGYFLKAVQRGPLRAIAHSSTTPNGQVPARNP